MVSRTHSCFNHQLLVLIFLLVLLFLSESLLLVLPYSWVFRSTVRMSVIKVLVNETEGTNLAFLSRFFTYYLLGISITFILIKNNTIDEDFIYMSHE